MKRKPIARHRLLHLFRHALSPLTLTLLLLLVFPPATGRAEPAGEKSPAAAVVWFSGEGMFDAGMNLSRAVEDWVESLGYAGLNGPAVSGLSWTRLLLSAVLMLLVALVAWFVLHLILRRAGRINSAEKQSALALLLTAARKPVALFLWIYGGYFALVPLIATRTPRPDAMRPFGGVIAAAGSLAFFWLLFRLITAMEKRLGQWAQESRSLLAALVPFIGNSLRVLIPLLATFLLVPLLDLPPATDHFVKTALGMSLIGSIGYILIAFISALERAILRGQSLQAADNLSARKIYTQVSVLKRIAATIIAVITVGCMLMLFEPVRQLGTSILASAGIAGIIIGLAAQKTLGNLIAGIQIALTQPMRIDDVVVVEGEWGRIEEITLTYVVVQIWDLRRLVVPITYFTEKPFQNWTRKSSRVLGAVMLYVDYTVPVETIRAELRRIVERSSLWDRQVCALQVTGTSERTIELRALVSAEDAPKTFDLRCEIREKLVAFLRDHHPESLPKFRAQLDGGRPALGDLGDLRESAEAWKAGN